MGAFLVYRHPITKEIRYVGTDEGRTFVENHYIITRYDAYLGAGAEERQQKIGLETQICTLFKRLYNDAIENFEHHQEEYQTLFTVLHFIVLYSTNIGSIVCKLYTDSRRASRLLYSTVVVHQQITFCGQ